MENHLIKPLSREINDRWFLKQLFIFIFLALAIGAVSGYFFRKFFTSKTPKQKVITKTKEGVVDKKTFRDQATGTLREGGINGEGSFHLERPGGESQNVYLTSSTVDLSKYIGKKVRVYGETFAGEKAGWLMDVGFIEIIQ